MLEENVGNVTLASASATALGAFAHSVESTALRFMLLAAILSENRPSPLVAAALLRSSTADETTDPAKEPGSDAMKPAAVLSKVGLVSLTKPLSRETVFGNCTGWDRGTGPGGW